MKLLYHPHYYLGQDHPSGRPCRREELGAGAPETAYRLAGARQIKAPGNGFKVAAQLQPGMRYRMRLTYRKRDLKVYENLAWQIDVELLDAKGSILARDTAPHDAAKPRDYNRPGSFRLTDTRSLTPTTPWIQTEYTYFDVPTNLSAKKVAGIRGRLSPATWSHPPSRIHEKSVLDLGPISIEPVGTVRRRRAEAFVAIVSPTKKGTRGPIVVRGEAEGGVAATVRREGRPKDQIVFGSGKAVTFPGGSITADLAVLREEAPARLFARAATSIVLRGRKVLQSSRPVDVSLRMNRSGSVTWAKVKTAVPTELSLAGRRFTLGPGLYVAGADGKLAKDPAGSPLETNAPANQKLLEAGLRPLIAECIAGRDTYTRKGLRNIAPGAKVTASATRDARFAPGHVIDDKTWEYPTNGVLDYTQGDLRTSPSGGYGRGKLRLSGQQMSVWPFYVRPTYWLLPYGQTGWVELALPQEREVSLVRLLNTSNAGLNDYATMRYRVELRNASGKAVARRAGGFGKRFDRPFRQAFKYPKFFASYGDTFRDMLRPGILVPFGDGWHDVAFEPVKAKFVRVYVDSFWAIGGGLNEIQVYPTPALRRQPPAAGRRSPSAGVRKPAPASGNRIP